MLYSSAMQTELFAQKPLVLKANSLRIDGRDHGISPVFCAYWRFAAERQAIFHRRLRDHLPITGDPVLARFKFTNAFRVLDRTSQFLLREVIHKGSTSPDELFFRIVLFKLFNKSETWVLLSKELGELTAETFDTSQYDRVLTCALESGKRIYSAAYIMPSGGKSGESKKHRMHLALLKRMMTDGVPERLQATTRMEDGFSILRSYPTIGNFLAYQFITDINYSELTNYSEMEFVIPGPGALDGLKKCFPQMNSKDASGLIRYVCENQRALQEELDLEPVTLFGRPLQLIDCQNLFCETDKYARVAFPEVVGFSGRTRIKQSFRMSGPLPQPVFPKKWNITQHVC